MKDITINEFCDIAALLAVDPGICRKYDWWSTQYYRTQKAHVLAWFASKPDEASTKAVYNRLQNAGMLVWLAAVFGVPESEISSAATAAEKADLIDYRRSCRAFRDIIPFDRIYQCIENPGQWVYDAEILDLTKIEENGRRVVIPGKEKELETIITNLFN